MCLFVSMSVCLFAWQDRKEKLKEVGKLKSPHRYQLHLCYNCANYFGRKPIKMYKNENEDKVDKERLMKERKKERKNE